MTREEGVCSRSISVNLSKQAAASRWVVWEKEQIPFPTSDKLVKAFVLEVYPARQRGKAAWALCGRLRIGGSI